MSRRPRFAKAGRAAPPGGNGEPACGLALAGHADAH